MYTCYIGDGVFAEIENGILKLTTTRENGIKHFIYLEPEVLQALLIYLKETGYLK